MIWLTWQLFQVARRKRILQLRLHHLAQVAQRTILQILRKLTSLVHLYHLLRAQQTSCSHETLESLESMPRWSLPEIGECKMNGPKWSLQVLFGTSLAMVKRPFSPSSWNEAWATIRQSWDSAWCMMYTPPSQNLLFWEEINLGMADPRNFLGSWYFKSWKGSVSYLSSPCFSTHIGGIGGLASAKRGVLAFMYWFSIQRGGSTRKFLVQVRLTRAQQGSWPSRAMNRKSWVLYGPVWGIWSWPPGFWSVLLSLTRSGRMRIGEVALGPLTFKPGDSASDRHKSWDWFSSTFSTVSAMSNSLVVAQGHLSKKSHLSNWSTYF